MWRVTGDPEKWSAATLLSPLLLQVVSELCPQGCRTTSWTAKHKEETFNSTLLSDRFRVPQGKNQGGDRWAQCRDEPCGSQLECLVSTLTAHMLSLGILTVCYTAIILCCSLEHCLPAPDRGCAITLSQAEDRAALKEKYMNFHKLIAEQTFLAFCYPQIQPCPLWGQLQHKQRHFKTALQCARAWSNTWHKFRSDAC